MTRPKSETEDLLFLITKICETIIKQTHRKAEETMEFELNKPRKRFSFEPQTPLDWSWMIVLTNLEVYYSIYNITEQNSNIELYKVPDSKSDGIS